MMAGPLTFWLWTSLLGMAGAVAASEQPQYHEIDAPPHNYRQRAPQDRFTRLKDDFESGRITLDSSSEKVFILSVLEALGIPATSQMLVFSTTSLQLSLISPANPRALYFNEDVYLGYVPGGRIEIVSLDPELGSIFYIFDIPKDVRPLRIERSERCMNCHVGPRPGDQVGGAGSFGRKLDCVSAGADRARHTVRAAFRWMACDRQARHHQPLGQSHGPVCQR